MSSPTKVFITVDDLRSPQFARAHLVDARYTMMNHAKTLQDFVSLRAQGSVFAELDTVLSAKPTERTGRHPLPAASDFIKWCMANGIGEDSEPIVCYDAFAGALAASRAWWMFNNLGLPAFVLDGGFQAYLEANLPTESGAPTPVAAPARRWNFKTSFTNHVDIEELPKYQVVEARSKARVGSTVRPAMPLDPVPGGIPGALTHEFLLNIEPGKNKLLPADELRKRMTASLGSAPIEKCAFSCGSGVTACHNIAVARHIGLGEPQLYVGSWSQYSKLKRDELLAGALRKHGMVMSVEKHNPEGIPIDPRIHAVEINGKLRVPPFFDAQPLDKEMLAALKYLRVGEIATVTFASGRLAKVDCTRAHEVPKSKL